MHSKQERQQELRKFRFGLMVSIGFVLLLWLVKFAELLTETSFYKWGILPRHFEGLKGIVFTPLIHGDLPHLVSNSVPLLILITLLIVAYLQVAFRVIGLVYLLGGAMVWAFANGPAYHIGASGVVYGLAAFLLASGIFRRDRASVAITLTVLILYGGIFTGILPGQEGISWESHLLGALVGIFAAFYYREVNLPKPFEWDEDMIDDDDRHFFERYPVPEQAAPEAKVRYIYRPKEEE